MNQETILLAEDNDDDVTMFQIAFNRATLPHVLRVVPDGQEAIEWLQGAGKYADRQAYPMPALLLTDIKMPRKNGFDVLQFVRETTAVAKLPVVILSSSDEPKDVKRAYDGGATTYFVKTPLFENVIHFIRTVTLPH